MSIPRIGGAELRINGKPASKVLYSLSHDIGPLQGSFRVVTEILNRAIGAPCVLELMDGTVLTVTITRSAYYPGTADFVIV